ncbi:MAG TPA: hypothetical protein VEL74_01400 [Thermoanaerobaculia bacterium]|nr:hypothetical protein [Thermoanaerobaculia bacterium]
MERLSLKALSALLLLILLLPVVACDSDDGNEGPTAPGPPLFIAGLWNGTFTPDGGGTAAVALELEQSGRLVTGLVAVGGLTWAIEGSVDSLGRFEWDTEGATCGSFDATMLVDRSRTTMAGSAQLDRFACLEGRRQRGDLVLQKVR